MKGVIWEERGRYYTFFGEIFSAIQNVQKEYNWLITDCEGGPSSIYQYSGHIQGPFTHETYCWLTGEMLTALVQQEDCQWVWAVLSGFPPDIPFSEIIKYRLPYADGNSSFWKNPVIIQHPLAELELVAWDSTCTLLFSSDDAIATNFMQAFPAACDLAAYNQKSESE